MAQDSKISWTTHTANLWWGCTSVHSGCDHCYAEALSKRFGDDVWGNDKPRREIKSVWNDLAKYQRLAKAAGEVHKVFVGSMMDIFEKPMPLIDNKGEKRPYSTTNVRIELFDQIGSGAYPNLLFLLLTKRPSNINKYIPEGWKRNPPANVMFGTSPVDQETADKLIPQLLEVKGKKFLSIEPQLDYVDLTSIKGNVGSVYQVLKPITGCGDSNRDAISWVIQGGESGHNKRPFNLDWAYSLKKQCANAGVPYFFKQIDKVKEIPLDLMVREFPKYSLYWYCQANEEGEKRCSPQCDHCKAYYKGFPSDGKLIFE
jgi:protein gp37